LIHFHTLDTYITSLLSTSTSNFGHNHYWLIVLLLLQYRTLCKAASFLLVNLKRDMRYFCAT
jgi:hypothetical protein